MLQSLSAIVIKAKVSSDVFHLVETGTNLGVKQTSKCRQYLYLDMKSLSS